MKLSAPLLLALLPLTSCSSISVLVGQRMLDDDNVEAVDEQITYGVETVLNVLPAGFGVELGASYATEDGTQDNVDVENDTLEGYAGIRYTFREEEMIRPYLGAGLSYLWTNFTADGNGVDIDEDDSTEGYYARAGVGFHFAVFSVGIDYRVLAADVDIEGEEIDLDFENISLFVGFSF